MKILGDYERVAVRWEGPYNEAKDDAQCYCGKCDLPLEEDDWNFCPKCGVGLLRYDYEQRYRRFADIGMTIELAFDQRDAKYLEIRDKDENLILFAENTQDLVDWIDEKHIAELVSQDIARRIVADTGYIGREAKYGVREAMDKGVRDYIYKEKESIIERVIDRAAKEIVRKGLPKSIE